MNYVESLNLFGVEAKEIPCIKGSGAPTTATEGAVGCLYMDTNTGNIYKCTAAANGVYTWKDNGSDGGVAGYYTPSVTQPTEDSLVFFFARSDDAMPSVEPVTINLPTTGGGDGDGGDAVDNSDTKITVTVADGYTFDIRGIYNLANHGGVTHVDWGDGSANDVVGTTDDEMKHRYTTGGTYTVVLTGLETVNYALKGKGIIALVLGSTVQTIAPAALFENNLTEVTIYAETPPALTEKVFDTTVTKIHVPADSVLAYSQAFIWSQHYAGFLCAIEEAKPDVFGDKIVTVGAGGDFATINEAIAYLSTIYPPYKPSGINYEVKILDGTIINEQIWVERVDLSYITITSDNADNTVQVDVTGWTGVTHDTRGNRPFFSAEYGARLPCIKCLFSAIVPAGGWTSDNQAVGYFCNRGSTGVIAGSVGANEVLANVGFENFYDNIIANNNSEIVLREAIARNAGRYGVLSRHISRVSARSADITNCADIAAYADRASMMDVRHADLSGSKNGIAAYHASIVTANETDANNIETLAVCAQYGSTINCHAIKIDGAGQSFSVWGGGTIVASAAEVTNATNGPNVAVNTLAAAGVIYS